MLQPEIARYRVNPRLASVDGSAQRFDLLANSFRYVSAALGYVADALLRVLNPIPASSVQSSKVSLASS